jgi:2-dehydropantoate 2-reductase
MTFQNIAIVGTGAIGGYYGARLARQGADVRFLARSDLSALQNNGITVRLPDESWTVNPVQAFRSPQEIGPCDLVIVSLKATANRVLAELIPPLLHSSTAILTLENGLGSDELLAEKFGAERVIGGLCFICVNRVGPGELWCQQPGSVSFAEFERPAGERVRAVAQLFSAAGIKVAISDHLSALRWRKLVWNVPFNGLSIAAGGVTTDRILADPELEKRVRQLMAEVIAAAGALGCAIPPDFIDQQIRTTRAMSAYRPSSLIDFQAGRAVEVEAIWGEPLRRAQAAGVAMPNLAALYGELKGMTKSA